MKSNITSTSYSQLINLKEEILNKLPTITGIYDILYYQRQLKLIDSKLSK